MNPFPRLRQACLGPHRGPSDAPFLLRQGSGAPDEAPCARSSPPGAAGGLHGQDPRLALNCLYLSGVLASEPIEDKGRDGEPVVLLLVAFPAPDAKDTQERMEVACCEVEVPSGVVKNHAGKLHTGESVFITGQLTGGGGVVATELHSGPPPKEVA